MYTFSKATKHLSYETQVHTYNNTCPPSHLVIFLPCARVCVCVRDRVLTLSPVPSAVTTPPPPPKHTHIAPNHCRTIAVTRLRNSNQSFPSDSMTCVSPMWLWRLNERCFGQTLSNLPSRAFHPPTLKGWRFCTAPSPLFLVLLSNWMTLHSGLFPRDESPTST